MTLKQEMDNWIKKYLAKGNKMVRYGCPFCKAPCYSVILDKGQQHDTMTTCPECKKHHFKVACDTEIRVITEDGKPRTVETEVVDKDSYQAT